MKGFKLRVEVLLIVSRVNESMQARAVHLIWREVLQRDCVPAEFQVLNFQADLLSTKVALVSARSKIDGQISDGEGIRIEKQLLIIHRHLLKVEVDLGLAEVVKALLQAKAERVVDIAHELGTSLCFLL